MGDGMAWTGWEEWLGYRWAIDYGYMDNQGWDYLRLSCWYVCLKGQG